MNAFAISGSAGETVTLTVSGDWSIRQGLPSIAPVRRRLAEAAAVHRVLLGTSDLGKWDSGLLTFLLMVKTVCRAHGIGVDASALPPGLRKLIELASAAPARAEQRKTPPSFLARIGASAMQEGRALLRSVAFLGESLIAFVQLLRGRARYRPADLFLTIQETGAQALLRRRRIGAPGA